MKRIKIKKYCGMEVNFNLYVVDFVREAGKTYAIIINEFGQIETCKIQGYETITVD